jgi:hypothetical protein
MPAPNFTLITELQVTLRRDFPLAVPGILNPLDSQPLVEGEWLELNSDYALVRGSTSPATTLAMFPIHTERGRYDTQAIQKATVLFAGPYEAETLVHGDLTGLGIGDSLEVTNITDAGGITRRGLIKAVSGKAVVGFVTKLPGTTATGVGMLRFLHLSNFILP